MQDDFYLKILDSVKDGVYFVDNHRRITFWNKGAERITGFRAKEVIGTGCSDKVLEHVDIKGMGLCNGNCPVSAIIRGELSECREEILLHHREGHRVPVTILAFPIVDEGGTVFGAVEIFSESQQEDSYSSLIEDLKKAALLDPLTGIANRRFFTIKLIQALSDFERYNIPFGVIFLDIDHFKDVNDTFGHPTGDRVLRMVGETLRVHVRGSDLAARYGGDEFVLILAHITPENLERLAEKLRALIEMSFLVENKGKVSVTASLGATMARAGDSADTILARADRLLYEAKEAGRNRCAVG